MITIVTFTDFENFPIYYVLDGDHRELDGICVGATNQDSVLESRVCDLDKQAIDRYNKFPIEEAMSSFRGGEEVAVINCGIIL